MQTYGKWVKISPEYYYLLAHETYTETILCEHKF